MKHSRNNLRAWSYEIEFEWMLFHTPNRYNHIACLVNTFALQSKFGHLVNITIFITINRIVFFWYFCWAQLIEHFLAMLRTYNKKWIYFIESEIFVKFHCFLRRMRAFFGYDSEPRVVLTPLPPASRPMYGELFLKFMVVQS